MGMELMPNWERLMISSLMVYIFLILSLSSSESLFSSFLCLNGKIWSICCLVEEEEARFEKFLLVVKTDLLKW